MAELKRIDEDISTAELIPAKQPEKPKLVKAPEPKLPESVPAVRTVEDADKLVAAVMQRLAQGFANERSGLEKQWDSGDNVSTEDLRLALQRYRSFFDRLLKL
jgi:hypothetical protein